MKFSNWEHTSDESVAGHKLTYMFSSCATDISAKVAGYMTIMHTLRLKLSERWMSDCNNLEYAPLEYSHNMHLPVYARAIHRQLASLFQNKKVFPYKDSLPYSSILPRSPEFLALSLVTVRRHQRHR